MSLSYFFYLGILYLCVFQGIIGYKKLTTPFKLFVYFLAITAISETLSRFFVIWLGYNTVLYHILIPIQFLFFGIFYALINSKDKPLIKHWYFILALIFSVFCILNTIFIQSVKWMPTYSLFLIVLYVVPVILLTYRRMLLSPAQSPLLTQPIFWINFGYLFFFTIALISLSFIVFPKYSNISILPGSIIYYSNLLLYVVLFIAIRLELKRNKESYG